MDGVKEYAILMLDPEGNLVEEEEDRHRSYALQVNSYVRKPVDYDRFQAAVRELGLYWTVLNEPPPLASSR